MSRRLMVPAVLATVVAVVGWLVLVGGLVAMTVAPALRPTATPAASPTFTATVTPAPTAAAMATGTPLSAATTTSAPPAAVTTTSAPPAAALATATAAAAAAASTSEARPSARSEASASEEPDVTPELMPGVVAAPARSETPALGRSLTTPDPSPTPTATATLAAVDWPDLPELEGRAPLTETEHFRVFAADPDDALLTALAERWAPRLEGLLTSVRKRLDGRTLPDPPVDVVFERAYPGHCPARGLASPGEARPLLMVFADETTPAVQLRGVLAHEMVHHLTMGEDFVGDAVLTEGVANWGAGEHMLDWQGAPSWDVATRQYLARGSYLSITNQAALNPTATEDCLARRDRVYNIRTSFVGWMVERYGLDTVLAMPVREVEIRDEEGRPDVLRLPDYEAATGHRLRQLEAMWLADLLEEARGL